MRQRKLQQLLVVATQERQAGAERGRKSGGAGGGPIGGSAFLERDRGHLSEYEFTGV